MLQVLFVLVVLALAVVVQVEVLAREAAVLLDPEDHLLEADGVDLEEGDKEVESHKYMQCFTYDL